MLINHRCCFPSAVFVRVFPVKLLTAYDISAFSKINHEFVEITNRTRGFIKIIIP